MQRRKQELEAGKLFLIVLEEDRKHLKMCLEDCAGSILSNGEDVERRDKAEPPSLSRGAYCLLISSVALHGKSLR